MINILVTGSNGQLATAIKNNKSSSNDVNYLFTNRHDFDITNTKQCEDYLKNHHVSFIINCAAYTQVDQAENDKELANNINSFAPKNLALLSKKYNIKLIHISTDYVYAGTKNSPYLETDNTVPVNHYGTTKLSGENNIISTFDNYIIIRTGWLYYYIGKNFFNTITNLIQTRDELSIVADQIGSPTYCGDLADFIIYIINQETTNTHYSFFKNIFNFSNMENSTWYDFACAIKRFNPNLAKLPCDIRPISTAQYPTAAKRPLYSVLDKTKAITTFNYSIPSWQEGLTKCINNIYDK